MSVFKRDDSRFYQYQFFFEGRRYRGSTKHTNAKAAENAEKAIWNRLANNRAGVVEHKPVPLFRDFADQFIERTKNEMRPNTSRGYSVSLGSLKPWFESKRLDEISADEIEKYKQSRMDNGLSPSTVNRDLACLRRILLFAVKLDLLATTPFVAHKVKFLREIGRERILSFDEERKYLAVASQPLRDVGMLISELGLRPEEACSIRREDVHLYAVPPFLHIPSGKTKNAIRDVALTERVREIIRRRLAGAKGEYLFPLRIGNETLTGMPRGKCYDWTRPMTELHPAHARALLASGIKPPFRIYDLRHTYGTRAAEAGMDVLTLQRLMGHADLKTTSRYVHLSKRHLADAQTRIERYRIEREIAEAELAMKNQGIGALQ